MTKQQFPDLTYPVSKMYEGIHRQDYAELSALLALRVRDDLRDFKPQFSNSDDKRRYDRQLESVNQALDELHEYYKNFHSGERRMAKRTAAQMHRILLKEIALLENLSKGTKSGRRAVSLDDDV